MIVDAHLDLAYNVARGRDVRQPAAQQPERENEIATVGLPDLRAGGVSLICGTIFCLPAVEMKASSFPQPAYHNSEEAFAQANSQLDWYHARAADGSIRLVQTGADAAGVMVSLAAPRRSASVIPSPATQRLPMSAMPSAAPPRGSASVIPSPGSATEGHAVGVAPINVILLLEGADPIRHADDVAALHRRGIRAVGLAWKQTRYAGGTGAPGPLTPAGRTIVRDLDAVGIIHDTSHLAEASFFELMDLATGPIMASHSNCRAIVPGDRHLSDEMIRAIAARDGVIGINFYAKFLVAPAEHGKRRATLDDVVRHVRHICEVTGSCRHVGLGTDMDGGLGREQIPREIITSTDLPRVGHALMAAGFSAADADAVLYGNWMRFFATALPAAGAS
jgi:membrane dipeptidase